MSLIERYRVLYEHEKDANRKMLAMLASVPEAGRSDARFPQAVTLADHLAACRENWLDSMDGKGNMQVAWWNARADLTTLPTRYATLERCWTNYLAGLDDDRLAQDFAFTEADGVTYRVPVVVQVEQLVGHAAYHRGQIALLTDQLGGATGDTDYVDWWWVNRQASAEALPSLPVIESELP